MTTNAALPTTSPTATASTTSNAGSPDDTSRSTPSSPTPPHSARRQACDSHGEAMTTMATTDAISGAVAKRASVSSTPMSFRTRRTRPRSANAPSRASIAHAASWLATMRAAARR